MLDKGLRISYNLSVADLRKVFGLVIALIVVVSGIAAVIFAVFVLALFVFNRINNKRYNGNKFLKYFSADDFPGLLAEPISFLSDCGQTLRGFLYQRKECQPKALVIFAHGFGAGHWAYTTELNTIVQAGYWVLAYDATGCAESDGKNLRGFDQGVYDLCAAVRYANNCARFDGMKKILLGHSWGAFCVLNSLEEGGISGAVAMCGFISGAKVLSQNTIGKYFPALTFLEEAFLRLFYRMRFGRKANRNSLKSLRRTKKKVLLIYGDADRTVNYKKNGAVFLREFCGAENVVCKVCEGKAHNPYLTKDAERAMNETFSAIAAQKKKNYQKAVEMYAGIDYAKITQEDRQVMRTVIEFCDSISAGQ